MSLIAWWPLNGDLKDYSGNKNNMTLYNNIALDNEGKIGKTYLAKQENSGGSMITEKPIELLGDFTWCLWVNPLGCGLPASDNSPNSGIMSNHDHPNNENFSVSIRDQGNNLYKTQIQAGYADNTRGTCLDGNITFPKGKWSHIAITRKGQEVAIYVNGIFDKKVIYSKNFKVAPEKFVLYRWAPSYTGAGGYTLYGRINDARVYDEVLSLKEIKEIAKAKILHYKFDDMQEPTTNITFGGVSHYGPYHDMAYTDTGLKFTIKDANKYIVIQKSGFSLPTKTLAISGVIKKNGIPMLFPGSVASTYQSASSAKNIVKKENGYFEIVQTYNHATSNWILHFPMTSAIGDVITIDNFMIEEKDHCTPYCKNTRDGKVHDCSGYSYHAELNNSSPQWIKDSKTGKGAYVISANQYIASNTLVPLSISEFTYSCWCKTTDSNAYLIMGGGVGNNTSRALSISGGKLCLHTYSQTPGSSNGDRDLAKTAVSVNDGKWHMLTVTYKNSTVKSYIDGKLDVTMENQELRYNNVSGSTAFCINYSNQSNFGDFEYRRLEGAIDDVRVYATALSSEDVMLMYNSKAAITKDGTFFTNSIEVDGFYNDIIKSENLLTNGFAELKNNTNFSGMTYIATDGVSRLGCFERAGALTLQTSEKIRINLRDTYEIGGYFKSVDPAKLSAYYVGMMCLDENGSHITHQQVYHYSNTRTTLAAPLNNGDTTVTLTSGTNWTVGTAGTEHHTKTLGICDRPEAPNYERNRIHVPYLSISGNVLTLKTAWTGGTVPAGTKVANFYSGGGYEYVCGSGTLPATWTKLKATVTRFRFGTKHIRFLWLVNYGQDSTYKARGADLYIKNITSKQDNPTKLKAEVEKTGTLKAKAINEVGITDHLIAYYDGKSYKDFSGKKNNLTKYVESMALPALVDGYKFTGTEGANINGILTPIRTNNKDFSIAINFTQSASGGTQRLFMGFTQNYLELTINASTASLTFSVRNSAYKGPTTATNSVVVGKKHCVVVTYHHATQTAKIYIDDKPVVSTSNVEPFLSCDHLLLGNWTSGTQGFKGTIHSCKIFDKCLSSSEVAIEYKTTGLKQVLINKDGTVYANSFNEVLI